MTLLRRIDAALTAPGTAHQLACVRTVLAAAIALRLLVGTWTDFAGRPALSFHPIGVGHLLVAVPPVAGVVLIQLIGVAAAVLAACARWLAYSLPAAWAALVVLGAYDTSGGKVMHNEVLLILATVPILFAPRDARIGDTTARSEYGWAPRAALVVVATVYLLTGLQKLRHSGPSWATGPSMSWILVQGAGGGIAPGLARWIARQPLLPQLFASGALALELLAPMILGFRRSRPYYLLAVAAMHGSIALFLGLDYSAWVLTVAAVALPWDSWVPARGRSAKVEHAEHAEPVG